MATSGTVEIKYNGAVLASVASGKTATLLCAGKVMSDDISVKVPTLSSGESDTAYVCGHFSETNVSGALYYERYNSQGDKIMLSNNGGQFWVKAAVGEKIRFVLSTSPVATVVARSNTFGGDLPLTKYPVGSGDLFVHYYTEWLEIVTNVDDIEMYTTASSGGGTN